MKQVKLLVGLVSLGLSAAALAMPGQSVQQMLGLQTAAQCKDLAGYNKCYQDNHCASQTGFGRMICAQSCSNQYC